MPKTQTQAQTQTDSKILVVFVHVRASHLISGHSDSSPLQAKPLLRIIPSTQLLHLRRDIFSQSKGFHKIIDPLILIDQLKRISYSRVTSSPSLYKACCRASTVIMRDFEVSWRWAGQAIGHLQSGKTVILLPLSDSRGAASVVLNHRWL